MRAKKLSVVGSCPRCGAPIYGRREIAEDEQPVSKKSCACIPEWAYLPTPLPYQPTGPSPLGPMPVPPYIVGDPPNVINPWAPVVGTTTCGAGTAKYEGPPVIAMN